MSVQKIKNEAQDKAVKKWVDQFADRAQAEEDIRVGFERGWENAGDLPLEEHESAYEKGYACGWVTRRTMWQWLEKQHGE